MKNKREQRVNMALGQKRQLILGQKLVDKNENFFLVKKAMK